MNEFESPRRNIATGKIIVSNTDELVKTLVSRKARRIYFSNITHQSLVAPVRTTYLKSQ
jgi:hypothetical protein